MPAILLFGIPLIVGVLMFGILSLPDEKNEEENLSKKKGKTK